MQVILIEGADGVGKTTFVRKLQKDLNGLVYHVDSHFDNTLAGYKKLVNELLKAAFFEEKDAIIFDRGWIGELVYGPKYRGTSRITVQEIVELEAFIREQATKLETIFIWNTPEKILTVYEQRGETVAAHDLDQIMDVQNRFLQVFEDVKAVNGIQYGCKSLF